MDWKAQEKSVPPECENFATTPQAAARVLAGYLEANAGRWIMIDLIHSIGVKDMQHAMYDPNFYT